MIAHDDTAARCDSCPLKSVCPGYVAGKVACPIGANIALTAWTALLVVSALLYML